MEQKMAHGVGLTARQKQLLDLAIAEPYIVKTFYLSGGTALSSWYLYHRESLDLDFFSTIPFDYEKLARWFRHHREILNYNDIRFDEDYGFLTVHLRYPDDAFLKVDFNYYSKTKIAPETHWRGLEIDSLRDIAVNKIQTIATLPRTRDYVDLYMILKQTSWTFGSLLPDHAKKFEGNIDMLQLAKNFLKVTEYTDFPKMRVRFEEKNMHTFYEDLARKLKPKILK